MAVTPGKKQLDKPGTYFRCLAFIDELHGFAGNIGPGYFPNVSDNQPLYETKDGGSTWQPVTTIEGPAVVGLCALQVLREEYVNAGNTRLSHAFDRCWSRGWASRNDRVR